MSVKQVEAVDRNSRDILPLPLLTCELGMFVKEKPDKKNMGAVCDMRTALCDMVPQCDMRSALCDMGVLGDIRSALCDVRTGLCDTGAFCDMRSALCSVKVRYGNIQM